MFYTADVGSQSVSCVAFCGTLMCAFQRQAAQRGAELLRWIKFSQRQYLPVFGYCQENHIRPARRCSSAVPARSCSAPLGNSVLRTHFSSSPLCLAKALFMDHIGFIPHINSKSDSFFSVCVCVTAIPAQSWCKLLWCCRWHLLKFLVQYKLCFWVEPVWAQGTYPGDFYGQCSVCSFTVSNLSSG